ncbi:hypothetical protein JTB14_007035 [Gonioctena quinquepunctata]|nr:hypothetical protein JTB14_007035 [Gonioctena quinquepunctata]
MNKILRTILSNRTFSIVRNHSGGLYEPTYLEAMKSKVPLYDTINIQLRGYDFPILENYQKFIHNILKNMEINVEDCWATPPQHMQIVTYKPKSEILNAQYSLKIYERTVQMTDISSIQLPLVMRAIEASLPAGVTLEIRPHEEADEEVRYVPDKELHSLKQELDELGGPSRTRK